MASSERICFVVKQEDKGERVDALLSRDERVMSRSHAQRLINDGLVTINDKIAQKNTKLKLGDVVSVSPEKAGEDEPVPTEIELNVKYEDDHLMVISKQAGLVVHPTGPKEKETLINALIHQSKKLSDIGRPLRPGIVHRLDKDTSGLMIIAKDDSTHTELVKALKERQIKRSYIALVHGEIETAAGKIDAPIGRSVQSRKRMSVTGTHSKEAVTNFEVIEKLKDHTLLLVVLETGRTHQIRVHMRYIGQPIVGDMEYGVGSNKRNLGLKRQFLHASKLEFDHPVTGERMMIQDDLPDDLKEALSKLRQDREVS